MFRKSYLLTWLAIATLLLTLQPSGIARAGPTIAERFQAYYASHDGMRVLGNPVTALLEVQGYPAQYFEKGRIEDHRGEVADTQWGFMYGRLTVGLMDSNPGGSVTGTSVRYADLREAHDPRSRHAPPSGFNGGTMFVSGKGVFVPYDAQLRPAPGYFVDNAFWQYINRADLFPGGWLHDIGLPMTDIFHGVAVKNNARRDITMQAFERTVLTYDPQNPASWQIERGNIGMDAVQTIGTPSVVELEIPAPNAQVTLPLHMLMRGAQPNERVTATLRWQDGTTLNQQFTLLRGEDGRGLLIDNLDWLNMLQPPEPRTQPATLEIRRGTGEVLARQSIVVLSPNDPNTQEIQVFWTISGAERVGPQLRRVQATPRIGTAALEELLWGPPKISQIGYGTAIPTPEQVLSYPGREPDWGPRVTLRKLTIENGVATADFSQELKAYGGGSTRVMFIRQQITQTLKQFPTVREVRIAIEGQTEGVLEP